MLKRQRKRLLEKAFGLLVLQGLVIYILYAKLQAADSYLQSVLGDKHKPISFQELGDISPIVDIRLHVTFFVIVASIWLYQMYRYLRFEDSAEDIAKEQKRIQEMLRLRKERLQWQGIGTFSSVPPLFYAMLIFIIVLAIVVFL